MLEHRKYTTISSEDLKIIFLKIDNTYINNNVINERNKILWLLLT
nr:MAG TPA: hypothetical protein [Caudoviricetes sp.]